MADLPRLWLRHEIRTTERRAPIVPADARLLVRRGIALTVEESAQRVFPIGEYAAAGCAIAEAGGWVDADPEVIVLGLKELPDAPPLLVHRHVFFGHAFKGQRGGAELLRRFARGGGTLLDIEYLVDGGRRRLAAFGYWAGYVGAALAVLHARGALGGPLTPWTRALLDDRLARPDSHRTHNLGAPTATGPAPVDPSVLVIGALGRCGRGARDALAVAGIRPTCWDIGETRVLDRAALLGHDVLVNAVLSNRPGVAFLTRDNLGDPARRLRVICDVSCDAGSACNVLPIYDTATDWLTPVRRLREANPPDRREGTSPEEPCAVTPPVDLIAIDNLPSLLPREASVAFSAELTPQLLTLGATAPWRRCADEFHAALRSARMEGEAVNA